MTASNPFVTARQLLEMTSPGQRYELVRGGLIGMEPTGGRHGQVTATIAHLLREYVQSRSAGTVFTGEPGFHLEHDPDTVLAPDVAFVSSQRLRPEDVPESFPDLAPDLVIEVMSPRDTEAAAAAKATTWLRLGARAAWIVDPRARRVMVHEPGRDIQRLTETETLVAGDVLTGFTCPVHRFFEA